MPTAPRQYVLLLHQLAAGAHWDLGLDIGPALATWQLLTDPAALMTGQAIAARRLQDHRLAYLDYEGPVAGDRGHVQQIDRGLWLPIEQTPSRWTFRLDGALLIGRFELTAEAETPDHWTAYRLPG